MRFLLILLWLTGGLCAQVPSARDTVPDFELDTVLIKGQYCDCPDLPLSLIRTYWNFQGAFHLRPDLDGNGASLSNMVNTVPGARFEERGWGGSRRLSMRGSLRRADFGIRNIKIYQNDNPLTSADGSTPMELLDPDIPVSWTFVKGGVDDATGGSVLIGDQIMPDSSFEGEAFATAGSFGLRRAGIRLAGNKQSSWTRLAYTRQTVEGYRQQESSDKHVLYFMNRTKLASNLFLRTDLRAFSGGWELPGSLDSLSLLANRQQALPYSIWANAGLHKQTVRGQANLYGYPLGMVNRYDFGISTTLSDKLNPYGTSPAFQGFKSENQLGFAAHGYIRFLLGDRSNVKLYPGLRVEIQHDRFHLIEYENAGRIRGNLNEISDTQFSRAMIRPEMEIHLDQKNELDLHGSVLFYQFAQNGRFPETTSFSSSTDMKVMPGIDYSHQIREFMQLKVMANRSISWPTHWELQYGGSIQSLQPEDAWNVELRWEYEQTAPGVHFPEGSQGGRKAEINLYAQLFNNAILPLTDEQGVLYYYNAGALNQFGLEANAWFRPWKLSDRSRVRFNAAAGLFRYVFGDYATDSGNLKGKYLPGWPLYSLYLEGQYVMDGRMSLDWSNFLSGTTLLDNANTDRMLPYLRGDMGIRYRINVLKGEALLLEAGVSNLYNVRYPSYLTLNAFGGRYFNPAPTRGVYAGLRFVLDR